MDDNQQKVWTIRELMKTAIAYLREKGYDEARLTVELLLSHTLNLQRIELYTNFDRPLTHKELHRFRSLFIRRLQHEPLQYIVHSAFFMGLQFEVDGRVLIPRPETETLVEEVLMECKVHESKMIKLLDVGTGSGNIAISIAKYAKNVIITALDKSIDALDVAQLNAHRHGVESKITFMQADIFNVLEHILTGEFDIIVSNPPYVSINEWEQLQPEVRRYEPRDALTDNADGLSFYKQLLVVANQYLKPQGLFIVEVGYNQASRVELLLRSAGYESVVSILDLQRIPRVVRGRKPQYPYPTN
ncbi:MAG: peptide chain release factor N(5)-glutamine methyltransferase [Bacteroidetes bacterium]|nr:peptide chain release factor N(5)-glutamine methyltransferase [Bacteroidota bacterium]